jgi:hypothetical protein
MGITHYRRGLLVFDAATNAVDQAQRVKEINCDGPNKCEQQADTRPAS